MKIRGPATPSSRIPPRPLPGPHRPDDPPLTTNPSHPCQTQSARSQRGEAQWEEELSLACTMFVNPKSGTYEPKPALFQLRELDHLIRLAIAKATPMGLELS